jgi:hypothetical protein
MRSARSDRVAATIATVVHPSINATKSLELQVALGTTLAPLRDMAS